ncbi:MAG: DUF4931 domain-containing protein [Gammaproteobacteria bacterium]|nr:DUF4931 domain-containing protein [Gammaproteobacteria bacterium]
MANNDGAIREIRINPIVPTESVLVATERSLRPKKAETGIPHDDREWVADCPFCPGNESRTPEAIVCVPENGPWAIRIVNNLYPMLGDELRPSSLQFGLQQTIDGYGRHEVIIDHHHHGVALHEMSESHLERLFRSYRDRMAQLYATDERIKYVLVFKNFGPAAGASIPHTHSQIIAMPVIPHNINAELDHSLQYFQTHRQCIFCALIDEALSLEATFYDQHSGEQLRKIDVGQYVVERGRRFIAIKPFASRYAWEIHILPQNHHHDFVATPDDDLQDLATVMKRVMQRLDAVLDGVQYNFFLHSAPHSADDHHHAASYHWHIEICPRTSIPSGFELGSGLFANTVSPESAAQQLRDVVLAANETPP